MIDRSEREWLEGANARREREEPDQPLTQGRAFDIGCRTALRHWHQEGRLPHWKWARSKRGRGVPWVVTIGDDAGPIMRILVDKDGATTMAIV